MHDALQRTQHTVQTKRNHKINMRRTIRTTTMFTVNFSNDSTQFDRYIHHRVSLIWNAISCGACRLSRHTSESYSS